MPELSLKLPGFTGFPQFPKLVGEIGERSQQYLPLPLPLPLSLPACVPAHERDMQLLFNSMPALAPADTAN